MSHHFIALCLLMFLSSCPVLYARDKSKLDRGQGGMGTAPMQETVMFRGQLFCIHCGAPSVTSGATFDELSYTATPLSDAQVQGTCHNCGSFMCTTNDIGVFEVQLACNYGFNTSWKKCSLELASPILATCGSIEVFIPKMSFGDHVFSEVRNSKGKPSVHEMQRYDFLCGTCEHSVLHVHRVLQEADDTAYKASRSLGRWRQNNCNYSYGVPCEDTTSYGARRGFPVPPSPPAPPLDPTYPNFPPLPLPPPPEPTYPDFPPYEIPPPLPTPPCTCPCSCDCPCESSP